ncbi:hypothetical protein C8J46_101577 [Sphingomonas sp. PP-F2F-A104-K0414]|uniref:hypothetical protein n=1 Tax=Sphingomonas sp. PP-F2F-A104-K0414 TaxID=2135661 RepID=UPI0010460A52|nr:hypothetical protein [Sphingomonas sp. PP-F2F-A104-K0414]TCQ01218.1 hypothetical protein C8J46_101577 [Sphingomonas sp. PP-F2F-A104-K0414]
MLAFLLLLQATSPTPTPTPIWKLADRTNSAGVRSISASVTGNDGLSRFVVKCDVASEPIVSIQFIQPQPLGSGADKLVAVRFDGGPAFTYNWQFPGTGTYIADPAAITKLTSFLVKSKTVRVETTNGASFAVQANFVAPTGDAMIRQVLGVCGYTLGVVPPVPAKPAAEPAE